MKKMLTIGWKDLTISFRDRAALILMLAAPFVLTLGMGFVTGRFSGRTATGLRDIPVVIVNQDEGEVGKFLVEAFASESLAELLEPATSESPIAAQQQVENDEVAAAVIVPAGFSASLMPNPQTGEAGDALPIEVYSNPARPNSSRIVQSIVEGFVNEVEAGRVAGQVTVTQLILNGLVAPQDAAQVGQAIGARLVGERSGQSLLVLHSSDAADDRPEIEFDILAYLAPGMAMLFLMYTVSHGGRSILAERDEGTLARMLTTPTSMTQILGGKLLGVYLTGVAQLGILILGSSLLFGLRWGDPLAVGLLVLAVAAGATGWGILLAAFARTPGQVSSTGSALMLIFGILGGSFFSLSGFPGWLRALSKITPNAWGLDGFTALGSGGTLADTAGPIGALLAMAAALFAVAVIVSRQRGLLRR